MYHGAVLQPRWCVATTAVWALPRSLATTGGIIELFSLPAGTKMFQFPALASIHGVWIAGLQPAGLSHSEIRGSKVICTCPRLIAAYHVLHRLREPRPAAYRSLSRPSSPPRAKASTRRPNLLSPIMNRSVQRFYSSLILSAVINCRDLRLAY